MSDFINTPPPLPTVAILGAGAMGSAMADRLLEQGFAVGIWNRTPGPAARLAEHGGTGYASPGEASAHADVVMTMLSTADAVREVMLEQGTLNVIRPGAVWAQMGTIGVEATDNLRAEVALRRPDVAFVDAPVSGSREPARSGRLVILASGPLSARSITEPVFKSLGRPMWLGEAGTGSRLKLVLNTWLAFEVEAAAEVAALADRLGVARTALHEAVDGGALASGVAMTKLAKMESVDYAPEFSLEWALKDLHLALAAAGVDVIPVAESIAERWQRLVADGYGHLDMSVARIGLGSPNSAAADGHAR